MKKKTPQVVSIYTFEPVISHGNLTGAIRFFSQIKLFSYY